MDINFSCNSCGHSFGVDQNLAGKVTMHCPNCGGTSTVLVAATGAKGKGQDMKTCPGCGEEIAASIVWCACGYKYPEAVGATMPPEATERFAVLRGAQMALRVILVVGTLAIVVTGFGVMARGEGDAAIFVGCGVVAAGIVFGVALVLVDSLIDFLICVADDVERAADALEATGKIVAEQDAEWRKKSEPAGTEERRDT